MEGEESFDEDDAPMAFMFDACKVKEEEKFTFESELTGRFEVLLKMITGDPGHQQSGQYLWPASAFNARWVLDHLEEFSLDAASTSSSEREVTLVELGAGCGLTGLALSHLPCVNKVVLTDYDYGALELLKENAAKRSACMGQGKEDFISVEEVKWGSNLSLTSTLKSAVASCNSEVELTVEKSRSRKRLLILGSDLIYCSSVCLPLFTTVRDLLSMAPKDEDNVFFLVSSFKLKDEIEREAVSAYSSLGLLQTEVNSLDVECGQCRCQIFRYQYKG